VDDKCGEIVCHMFGKTDTASPSTPQTDAPRDGVLAYVYPLVDVVLTGPFLEDVAIESHCISITRHDGIYIHVYNMYFYIHIFMYYIDIRTYTCIYS
jgi:hypothetical protein